jgi:UDP-N-acetylmuramoylalanine--D-glutamate ligase
MDFTNKKIAVLGAGIEGISSALYLAKKGATVVLHDKKEVDKQTKNILQENNIRFVGGDAYLDNLFLCDIVVRSPGIKRDTPQLHEAAARGVVITSQTKLFLQHCPGKIIGVTGTKGKGTTSSLVYEMLKKEGFDAYIGGNIGTPPFAFLDKLTKDSWVVLELSSFQLQDADKSPHIAVILMVTSEHLDYHKDVLEYIDAKRNIVRHQTRDDFAVLNRDYPASNESDIHTDAQVYFVSREREVDEGCFVKDDTVFLRNHGKEQKIIESKDILLPGKHNLENVCAAVMGATLAGVSKDSIVTVLKTFKGLEHRLELVADMHGVKYYDDSFSTTPETAIAAIESFTDPEILILGGSSKQSDFTELGITIRTAKNIKAIIGVGAEWPRIKEAIGESGIEYIEGARSMPEIVLQAREIAETGDIVLLSPACASFDMFKNYKERGEQFKKAVLAS